MAMSTTRKVVLTIGGILLGLILICVVGIAIIVSAVRGSRPSIGVARWADGRPGTSNSSDQSTRRSPIGPKPIRSGNTGRSSPPGWIRYSCRIWEWP